MTRADRQGLGTSNKIEQKVAHVETKKIIFSWMMDNEKGTPENSVSKTGRFVPFLKRLPVRHCNVLLIRTLLAGNLEKFFKLGCMPTDLCLSRPDEGNGIEGTFLANKARWHKSCYALFNSTKVKRAEKRHATLEEDLVGGKFTRSNVSVCSKETVPACFICDRCDGQTLHNVSTLGLDDRVRESATLLNEERLLAKLSGGDLIALEAKYHTKCLSMLYRKAQYAKWNNTPLATMKKPILECSFMRQMQYSVASRRSSCALLILMFLFWPSLL